MLNSGYSLSDIAAATGNCGGNNNGGFGGFGGDNGWLVLIILLALFGGLGGRGFGGGFGGGGSCDCGGGCVTESQLCTSMNFNNLENAVGRLSDQNNNQTAQLANGISNLGYDQLRSFNAIQAQSASETAALSSQMASQGSSLQAQLADCLKKLITAIVNFCTFDAVGSCMA